MFIHVHRVFWGRAHHAANREARFKNSLLKGMIARRQSASLTLVVSMYLCIYIDLYELLMVVRHHDITMLSQRPYCLLSSLIFLGIHLHPQIPTTTSPYLTSP